MKIVQLRRQRDSDWEYISLKQDLKAPLVLVFGNRFMLEDSNIYSHIKTLFPDGHIVFGSTSGDITANLVDDESITITAIEFERSSYVIKTSDLLETEQESFNAGADIVDQFEKENLKLIFVVSEGSFVNGSQLAKGMNNSTFLASTFITGGLCGDGARFEKTIAGYNEAPKPGKIVAIGFYGDTFEASFSIHGGWSPFGPQRIVTKSKANVLYELDGQPALDLYKKYLGDKAKELPSAALLYPLNVTTSENEQSIVRTILNINEADNSMILAGDIPESSKVQLMMTNIDNIANASERAAMQAIETRTRPPELALLVSCIGRKLVLDQRVEEEIEEVVAVVGEDTVICGFYSYGEIAPFHGENSCKLHNQTMTITLISE